MFIFPFSVFVNARFYQDMFFVGFPGSWSKLGHDRDMSACIHLSLSFTTTQNGSGTVSCLAKQIFGRLHGNVAMDSLVVNDVAKESHINLHSSPSLKRDYKSSRSSEGKRSYLLPLFLSDPRSHARNEPSILMFLLMLYTLRFRSSFCACFSLVPQIPPPAQPHSKYNDCQWYRSS